MIVPTQEELDEIRGKKRFARIREIIAKSLKASQAEELQGEAEDLVAALLFQGLFRPEAEQRDTLIMVVAVASLTAFLAEVNKVLPEASSNKQGDNNGWN